MSNFAKGLVAGTIHTPPKMSWWPRHMRALSKIVAAADPKGPKLPEGWPQLEDVAKEWEAFCPKSARHGLMHEHSLLEVALLNSVRKNDVEDIERIGKKLYENVTEMSAVLGIAIVQFPEKQFKKLFGDHVALYAGCVRKKIEGVAANRAEMESNTLALADLTAEWL